MEAGQGYELLERTGQGSVETWAARDKSNGREVSLHLLTGGAGAHGTLLQRMARLPEWAALEILGTGENEGVRFFVTEPWLRTESFEEWVIGAGTPNIREDEFAKAGTWRVPTVEFGRRSASSQKEPGEFTRLFQPVNPAATPPIPEPLPDPNPEPEPPPPGTPVSAPGLFTTMFQADQLRAAQQGPAPASGSEFTRMFQAAPPLQREDIPTAEMPISSLLAPESTPPVASGDFTRMFQMAPAEASRTKSPATEASGEQIVPASRGADPASPRVEPEPGEFTRMFRVPPPGGGQSPLPPPATGSSAESLPQSVSSETGEFTRMFRTPAPAAVPPAPSPSAAPPPDQPSGNFTRMFQTSRQERPSVQPDRPDPSPVQPAREFTATSQTARPDVPLAIRPPQSTSDAPGANQTPGDFTAMFQAFQPGPPSAIQPPPEQPEQHSAIIATVPPAEPAREPGEFTRMFKAAGPLQPPTQTAQFIPQSLPPAVPSTGSGQARTEPGEFTRNFQTSRPAPPSAIQPVPAQSATATEFSQLFQTSRISAPAPASRTEPQEPGDSAGMFAPASRPPSSIQPPSPVVATPGEFTRMFEARPPVVSQTLPSPPSPVPPVQQPVPSDFDKLFNAPPAASTPGAHPAYKDPHGLNRAPAAQPVAGQGGFTQIFGSPALPAGASASFPAPQNVPQPPPSAPPPPMMGTYTKMFSTGAAAPASAGSQSPEPRQQAGEFTGTFPAPAGAEAPQSLLVNQAGQSSRKASRRKPAASNHLFPLYILLGILVVALVIVIAVLAFR